MGGLQDLAARRFRAARVVPALADRVLEEFNEDLSTRSGRLARLLSCANVLRLARRAAVPSPLAEPARKAADELLESLAGRPPGILDPSDLRR